jgi:GNAT superfamily N-acetyltransferase
MSEIDAPEIREVSPGETHLVHEAMHALRPAHENRDEFVRYVDDVLRPAGYRLLASFLPGREQAVAATGFRIGDSLAWGHYLYVDDLSTLPESRGQGHARALLARLAQEGAVQNCAQIHLTSVVGASRFDAHRLYYNSGFGIYAHHFTRALQ